MPKHPRRPKVYECSFPNCGKKYSRPILIRQHENSHVNKRPFKCPEPGCDKAFFKNSNLKDHEYTHRPTNERPFACRLCEMKFISLDRLRKHELTHTERYKCSFEECSQAFWSYQGLKRHKNMVHDRILNCDICNKFFQLPRLVQEHRINKHFECPSHPCTFSGCYLVYPDESALKKHIHEQHPELKCENCNEKFIGEKALKIHMSVHNDIRANLYQCTICNDRFVATTDLALHMKQLHGHIEGDSEVKSQLEDYFGRTGSPSLEGLAKTKGFTADSIMVEESERKRPRRAVPPSNPLLDSSESVIKIVSEPTKPVFRCPYKSCQRKFIRKHFFDKHLMKHLEIIERDTERQAVSE